MNSARPIIHSLLLLVAIVASVVLPASVAAQSGRRTPKKPEPIPEASPEPTATPQPKVERPSVGITVGINGNSGFTNFPTSFYDSALGSCAERLRQAPSASVHVSGREMNRADAVKLAKSQHEGFVVYLEL